ncbi:MAG: DUF5686 and carboxypeptidase regulatory-like domain-containing protein [Spirosomataceae bacterium]
MKKGFINVLFLFSFFFIYNAAWAAGGLKGTIKNTKGEGLSYAAVVVKGTSYGTMANAEGNYELNLLSGTYEIVFQYLGYKSVSRKVEITDKFIELNIQLEEQIVALQDVKVKSTGEDPALTIMRKAIATSKIHLLEVDSFTARAYMKGGGKITNIPALLESRLKKEGIEENILYFTETVSEINFKQPQNYRQRIISTRSNFSDFGGYNSFVNASFYQPEVGGAVSPLSPRAFSYYKFEYLGTFTDRGVEVSKIKVKPRSGGDKVFEGTIYIIENNWSIHSLNLTTYNEGFKIDVKQVFSPIQDVWMPITFQFLVSGGIFGFKGNFNYNITASYNQLKINSKFHQQLDIVDEKIDKTPTTVEKVKKPNSKALDLEKTLSQNKEINRKQLNKLIKEYEKEDLKQRKKENKEEAQIVRNDSISFDTLYRKRPTSFWDSIRPVPLTEVEIKSTIKLDSIKIVQKEKETKDSLKVSGKKFKVGQLFTDYTWNLGKPDTIRSKFTDRKWYNYRTRLIYESPVSGISYNTVEGIRFKGGLGLRHQLKNSMYFKLMGYGRYSIAREKLLGYGSFTYRYKKFSALLNTGSNVQQYNPDDAIPEEFNAFTTAFLEQNFMKLFEKRFTSLNLQTTLSDGLSFKLDFEVQQRFQLENQALKPVINWKNREFTSNIPINAESSEVGFGPHNASLISFEAKWKPIVRYRVRNGRKRTDYSLSPELMFHYRGGIKSLFNSDVDYSNVELSFRHQFNIGVRGQLQYALTGGTFLSVNNMYLPDYKHFNGNLAPIQVGDPVTTFRMLDYYRYSTKGSYLEAHGLYNFRKFLFTRIPVVRIAGIKENLFANYLHTSKSGLNYLELGYGVDGILRLFRAEVVTNFINGSYHDWAIRIGLNTRIQIRKGQSD